MNRNLTPAARTYIYSAPVAAGTDGAFVTSLPEIDMRGYDSARIIVHVGTVTGSGVLTTRLKNSNTSGSFGAGTIDRVGTDIAGGTSDRLLIHDVYKPKRRYLRLDYQRTVANVVINSIIVELYNAREKPVTQAAADVTASQVLAEPEPSAS